MLLKTRFGSIASPIVSGVQKFGSRTIEALGIKEISGTEKLTTFIEENTRVRVVQS